jgi:hypothetical protein
VVEIELAAPGDDPGLRRLLRENPLPGRIALSYEREPSYFRAAAVEGPHHQTVVARDEASGEVLGCANRSVRQLFVNGEVRPVGYMSQLRLHPRLRRGLVQARCLARAWELYRELHRDGRAAFYLMSIVAGNERARRLLTSGLPGFPTVRACGRLVTSAIHLGRPRRPLPLAPGLRLARGGERLMPAIAACLARNGSRRQFAPHWTAETLCRPAHTPGLAPEDFFVVIADSADSADSADIANQRGGRREPQERGGRGERGERVVGCLAAWDQSAVKQTVVRGYSGALAHWRKPLNLLAPLTGLPRLPAPGTELRSCFASHRAVDGDSGAVFAALLRAVYNHAALRRHRYLTLCLGESDPWRAVLRRYRTFPYPSELYLAAWEQEGQAAADRVDGRLPGVEAALL